MNGGSIGVRRVRRGGVATPAPHRRNADGSVAEMCGNGTRVFARYLVDAGLAAPGEFGVATRGGLKRVRLGATGDVSVDMGRPRVLGESAATVGGRRYHGLNVSMGNPHLACLIGDPVAGLDLSREPEYDREVYPHGVNVELVNTAGDHVVDMRVHERGSGETRSCGTGAVATAVAAAHAAGEATGTWTVHVLGGTVTVTLDEHTSHLAGPAVLVASGDFPAVV
jgi:diaminopimelate epimerase